MTLSMHDFVDAIYAASPRAEEFYKNIIALIPPDQRQDVSIEDAPFTLDKEKWAKTDHTSLQMIHTEEASALLLGFALKKMEQTAHVDDVSVYSGPSVLWTMRTIFARWRYWFDKAPYVSPTFLYEWFKESYRMSDNAQFKRLRDVHGSQEPHFLKNIRSFIKYISPMMEEMGYERAEEPRRPLLRWWNLVGFAQACGMTEAALDGVREKTKASQIRCFHRKESTN